MFVLPLTSTVVRRSAMPGAFDRLFDVSPQRATDSSAAQAVRTPAMDVDESDTAYMLRFDVPGASREQLEVTVEGRRVSVATAASADASGAPDARPLYRERGTARYARTVSLPAEVDSGSSQARFDNGVLTLTLAKKVPAGARRISVE